MPAAPSEPSTRTAAPTATLRAPPWGRQPSARATPASTATWIASVARTPAHLAPTSRPVERG